MNHRISARSESAASIASAARACIVHFQQAARAALRERCLRDAFGQQVEVEVKQGKHAEKLKDKCCGYGGIYLFAAQKEPVQIGQRQLIPGWTAMIALIGAFGRFHLAQ